MNPDLLLCVRSLTRFVYFVTAEEDRFLKDFRHKLADEAPRIFVYSSTFGMQPIDSLLTDWQDRSHKEATPLDIHTALIKIYKDEPKNNNHLYYVILDAHRFLEDPQVCRRILNVVHQQQATETSLKTIVFVGAQPSIPQLLQGYIEVVRDKGMTDEEVVEVLAPSCEKLGVEISLQMVRAAKGLTPYSMRTAIQQSMIRTKDTGKITIDPKHLSDYKRKKLNQSNLVSYVDTTDCDYTQVGGIQRFKAWANKTKACWTEEGQKFGLKPPRGVLLVGVWGCGKSLSVKALGNAWGLPVVHLDISKLRAGIVGSSEANVIRAISLIESVAPCVVMIDEAEKALSGSKSSNQSDSGTTSRMLGQLSTWMQETTAPICVAMTANSVTNLPTEFIRRVNERFFFQAPSEEERVDILKIHLKKVGQDYSTFDLATLAETASAMVGSEIEQAIHGAMLESFSAGHSKLDEGILKLELKRKPRILKTLTEEMSEVLSWVGWDSECQDGIRARLASEPSPEFIKALK